MSFRVQPMHIAHRAPFPAIEPFNTGFLPVSDLHTVYYEECGNPAGKPVIFLHGGPGGALAEFYRTYFNPAVYRIILLQQRGSGKSTPFAELRDNTTWHLVADVEKLREHLGIDRWVVFGGSWGSTLSLAYAVTHPERVKALVLRGVFLLRREEIQFFYQDGSSWMFPEEFDKYKSVIPVAQQGDLVSAYYRYITGSDEAKKIECARAWSRWEMATSRLLVDPELLKKSDDDKFAIAFASIESHFFVHGGWFDTPLLDLVHKIKDIPTFIVQGRYDMVCPAKSAHDLYKKLVEVGNADVELVIVPDAGHSIKEAGITHELLGATERFEEL